MRADPAEFIRLPLRAHTLLEDVPLHDVWAVDLPAATTRARTLQDLRAIVSMQQISRASAMVGFFFWRRRALGRIFGWDDDDRNRDHPSGVETTADVSPVSYVHRLTAADRERSLIEPGTPDGPGQTVYALARESVQEIRNATVHAFSVFALTEHDGEDRLYWAIYVLPVGGITRWYMRLIDPFRRRLIYPAILRHIRAACEREGNG